MVFPDPRNAILGANRPLPDDSLQKLFPAVASKGKQGQKSGSISGITALIALIAVLALRFHALT